MPMSKSKIAKSVKEYFLIAVGMAIYTLGWTIFLTPNNLVGGGVTGVSSIIQYATGIKMGYSYLVINVFLLLISFLVIGPMFGAKTIYAIILECIPGNRAAVHNPRLCVVEREADVRHNRRHHDRRRHRDFHLSGRQFRRN